MKKQKGIFVRTKDQFIKLKRLHREYNTAFPISEAGFIFDHTPKTTQGDKTLELCLRLTSETKYSDDVIGDTRYRLRFPNVFLKVPGVWRQINVRERRSAVFFKYEPELKDAMEKAGLLTPPYAWEIRLTPTISSILKEAEQLIPRLYERGTADRFDLLAIRLFHEVLLYRDNHRTEAENSDESIRQIAAYIHSHFLEEIDWDDLLKNSGLSRRNFFRRWNELFTATPAASIRNLKLEYARNLLAESDIPIWELAKLLHFSNANYFCMLFKKQYGISPYLYHVQTFQKKN